MFDEGGDRISLIAMNSACIVPFLVRFVAFMPRPIIPWVGWTIIHPTGVSEVWSASSAYFFLAFCVKGDEKG